MFPIYTCGVLICGGDRERLQGEANEGGRFLSLVFLRKGGKPSHAGPHGEALGGQKAEGVGVNSSPESLLVSTRQGTVHSVGLGNLNNFCGL